MRKGLLLFIVTFCASCACFSQQERDDSPKCVAARAAVDCAKAALPSLGVVLLSTLESLIGQPASIDWAQVGKALGGVSLRGGACFLARIDNLFLRKLGQYRARGASGAANFAAAQQASFRAFFGEWVRGRGLDPDVRFDFGPGR